jgi:hypothetical protein
MAAVGNESAVCANIVGNDLRILEKIFTGTEIITHFQNRSNDL